MTWRCQIIGAATLVATGSGWWRRLWVAARWRLAAVSMLSAAGIVVAIDASSPITDNAGGIAAMRTSGITVQTLQTRLDAAGNIDEGRDEALAAPLARRCLAAVVLFAESAREAAKGNPGQQL